MAKHKGEHYKRYYDAAVRENKLEVGDRVLVRAVGFQGKHKIADRWEGFGVVRQVNYSLILNQQGFLRKLCPPAHSYIVDPTMIVCACKE